MVVKKPNTEHQTMSSYGKRSGVERDGDSSSEIADDPDSWLNSKGTKNVHYVVRAAILLNI